jgi:hypothetical protein
MLYIDAKYVSFLSSRVRNFKQKKDYLWNMSCPFCGDSSKNKLKARGYVYRKKSDLFYSCHNCGKGTNLGNLLKEVDSLLYSEYVLERYKESVNKHKDHRKVEEVIPSLVSTAKPVELTDSALESLSRCDTLPITHMSVSYLISRKIPKDKWKLFYHTDTFKEFTNTLLKDKFQNVLLDHPRLIIPYFTPAGKMYAYQGRAYGDIEPKYYTIKLDDNEEKVYGLDTVDYSKRIYVVEGPIDSIFLSNGLAVSGSSFDVPTIRSLASNATLVMDNEPRNKEIMKQLAGYIEKGYSVCIWPDSIKEKDINEMILAGKTSEEVMELINTNTYTGLSARLRYNEWRKC